MSKKNLILFGSDFISQRVLNKLVLRKELYENLLVVCPPYKKPRTPLADLHDFIRANNLPILYEFGTQGPEEWVQLDRKLKEAEVDFGIVASFGHMIPGNIIDHAQKGMMVVHPSLLPKYRGSCPIQHAILNRDRDTGVSIIEISKNIFDAGSIYYQASVEIDENTRFDHLSQTLADLGGQGVCEVINDFKAHQSKGIVQDPKLVTSARMIKNEYGLIKFSELAAIDVQCRFNALYGSNTRPRAMIKEGFKDTFLNTPVYFDRLNRVKFDQDFETDILIKELEQVNDIKPGQLHWNLKKAGDRVFVKCAAPCSGKYDWVWFSEMTLTGAGKVSASNLIKKYFDNKPYHPTKNPYFKFSLF